MRRRRLIGMYRGLRKSISAVALVDARLRGLRPGGTTQDKRPARPLGETYPIVKASTISAAPGIGLRHHGRGLTPLIWSLSRVMQGAKAGSTPAAPINSEEVDMTTFDKREEAFEKKFAQDEALKFRATARRNKLLGLWAAEKLGLSGPDAEAYAKEVVLSGAS